MKYLDELEKLGCRLVRKGEDFDFLLLNKNNKEKVENYLINNGFVLFKKEKNKLNFKISSSYFKYTLSNHSMFSSFVIPSSIKVNFPLLKNHQLYMELD